LASLPQQQRVAVYRASVAFCELTPSGHDKRNVRGASDVQGSGSQ
jgi:hypothetical protein